MRAVNSGSQQDAENIALKVMEDLAAIREKDRRYIPSIEGIQNMVENALMSSSFHDVAKAYILYRNEHARQRQTNIFEKRVNLEFYHCIYAIKIYCLILIVKLLLEI